jgi:drug/metabolite transporter (DMT)-like permease
MTDVTPKARLRTSPRDRLVGIGLMILALFLFSLLDATAKLGGRSIPVLQLVWVRFAGNVLLVLVFVNGWTRPGLIFPKRPGLQLLRSTLLFGSTVTNFFALRWLQLAETTAILFSTPLIVALLAGPVLGEALGKRRIGAICVGFIGMLVITRPGLGAMHPAAFLSLAGCCCYAGYVVVTRKLASYDAPETTMIYSGITGTILLAPVLPFVWETPQSAYEWGLMIALPLLGGIGHNLFVLAHQRAPAGTLAPFMYVQILWMIGLGLSIFGDVPDTWTMVGCAVIVASGLFLIAQERRSLTGV